MLKRLILTAFALGLFMAFSNTVLADVPLGEGRLQLQQSQPVVSAKEMPQPGTVPDARFKVITPTIMPTHVKNPATSLSPDTAACFYLDFWDGATAFDFGWGLGGSRQGRALAMRFDIPKGHTASVNATDFFTFGNDVGTAGVPANIVVEVYDDLAGLPGNLLSSDTLVLGVFGSGFTSHVFPSPVLVSGGAFHIAYSATGGDVDGSFTGDSDDGGSVSNGGTATGTGRSSVRDNVTGLWATGAVTLGDGDPNFDIAADYCVFFSSCFSMNGLESTDDGAGGSCGSVGLWFQPDPAWASGEILSGFAQRFVAEGPETLTSVTVQHLQPAWFFGPLVGYDSTSTNGFIVEVWPDDGMGNIDETGGPLATGSIAGGLASMFPVTGNSGGNGPWERIPVDFSASNLVLLGPYHISVRTSSTDDATGFMLLALSSSSSCAGTGTGSSVLFTANPWERQTISGTWSTEVGGENAFLVRPALCRDEFSLCQVQPAFTGGLASGYGSRLDGSRVGMAAKMAGKPVNRVEKLRFQPVDFSVFGAPFNTTGTSYQAVIYADDNGGLPGTEVYRSAVINQTDPGFSFWPGWTEVVIPGGVRVFGDFFVGYENATVFSGAQEEQFVYGTDGDPIDQGGMFLLHDDLLGNPTFWTDEGAGGDLFVEAEFCSIPVDERACVPSTDWPTVGFDYARTSASGTSVGDAWCDMTLNWNFVHPTLGTTQSAPIIYNSMIIAAFTGATSGEYMIFDLATGAPIATIASVIGDDKTPGGTLRNTPTVATVGGIATLYVASGTNAGVLAYDISVPATPVQRWAIAPSNGWQGHSNGMASIRYGAMMIVNQGGTDVLYFNDDNGTVYAADAATGAPFVGWQTDPLDPATYTPVTLSGNPLKSGATDGSNLYYATFSAADGDIVAIDAATGAITWALSAGDGLQAANVGWTTGSPESFQCGVAVDGGQVFATSVIGFPDAGTYYDLNAATGAVNNAAQNDRVLLSMPIVDVSTVTWPTLINQIPTITGGDIAAFSRVNGAIIWANSSFDGATLPRYRTNPSLSCEVDKADLAFAGNRGGYFAAFDNNTGAEMFNRRISWVGGANEIGGSAIGVDGLGNSHVVMLDQFGGLYDLASTGVMRPRLEILADGLQVPVEFGSPADVIITFPQVYRNSGCADLFVDLVADAASNGGAPNASSGNGITVVRDQFASSASSIADQLTASRFDKIEALSHRAIAEPTSVLSDAVADRSALNLGNGRNSTSRSASAVPAFLVDANGMGDVFDPTGGAILTAAGDTADIRVHVVGPLINRGPQSFFVTFQNTNDPDYWLNAGLSGSVTLDPEITLTLVGGCLLDTVALNFGAGAGNFFPAFNTGRISGFTVLAAAPVIDGNANIMFAGTYVYAVSQQRLAVSSDVWSTASYGNGDYISLQADPNFVSGLCKPDLASGVTLGEISSDGLTYTPILGDVVSRSWIDSVEVYSSDGDGWDWFTPSLGFDNDSTMGTSTNSTIFAAQDEATSVSTRGVNTFTGLLNNCVVDILEITERNGNAITGFGLGCQLDPDINGDVAGSNGVDTTFYDASVSASWSTDNTLTDIAAGYVKLPFGCGETPMIAARGIDSDQSMFNADMGWDSTYGYMQIDGASSQSLGGADEQAFYTFLRKDIAPNETFKFAAGYFSFAGIDNTSNANNVIADAAYLMNKWVGFGRGDVNDDQVVNIADIISLAEYVNFAGKPGPYPFHHLGDVDGTAGINTADVQYLVDFYFNAGPCPVGAWEL